MRIKTVKKPECSYDGKINALLFFRPLVSLSRFRLICLHDLKQYDTLNRHQLAAARRHCSSSRHRY